MNGTMMLVNRNRDMLQAMWLVNNIGGHSCPLSIEPSRERFVQLRVSVFLDLTVKCRRCVLRGGCDKRVPPRGGIGGAYLSCPWNRDG